MKQYNTKKLNSWEKSGIKPNSIPKQEFIDICEILSEDGGTILQG